MATSIITQERLKELFSYDPETGLFTRNVSRRGRYGAVGRIAGKADKYGYIVIGLDTRYYKAHRLAWLYVHGQWPEKNLDHIDGNPKNNRIANLREATQAENVQNQRKARRDNLSGVMGAQRNGNGWCVRIKVNGVRHYVGQFRTIEEAGAAYLQAKRRMHEFNTL